MLISPPEKVSVSLAATVSQPNMFMKGLSMSNLVSGQESVTVISIVIVNDINFVF